MGRNRHTFVLLCMGAALLAAVSVGGVAAADSGEEPSLSGEATPEGEIDTAVDRLSNVTTDDGRRLADVIDSDDGNYTADELRTLLAEANATIDDARLEALVANATGATPDELPEAANETLGAPELPPGNSTNGTTDDGNGSAGLNDLTDPGGAPGIDLGLFPEDDAERQQTGSESFGGLSRQSQSGSHWSEPAVRDPSIGISSRPTAKDIREAEDTGPGDGTTASGDDAPEVSVDGSDADTLSSDGDSSETAGAAATDDTQMASLGWFGLEGVFAAGPPLFVALLVVVLHPLLGGASVLTAAVFDWLSRIGVVLRYSRRDDSDPLEHETRADIYEILTSDPGTTLPDLSDRLETPLSTVRYHVQVLQREGLISSQKQRGNRRFYPVGVENEALTAALQTDTTADIVRSLADRGAATVGDLVDDIGKSYSTVSHHISRLVEDDIIVREKEGRQRVCRLTSGARTALSDGQKPAPEMETSTATAD